MFLVDLAVFFGRRPWRDNKGKQRVIGMAHFRLFAPPLLQAIEVLPSLTMQPPDPRLPG
jgi:hypothetical protein